MKGYQAVGAARGAAVSVVVEAAAANTDSVPGPVLTAPMCAASFNPLRNPGKEFQGGDVVVLKMWFPEPATSASPRDLLQMHVQGCSQTYGVRNSPSDSDACGNLRTTGLQICRKRPYAHTQN